MRGVLLFTFGIVVGVEAMAIGITFRPQRIIAPIDYHPAATPSSQRRAEFSDTTLPKSSASQFTETTISFSGKFETYPRCRCTYIDRLGAPDCTEHTRTQLKVVGRAGEKFAWRCSNYEDEE